LKLHINYYDATKQSEKKEKNHHLKAVATDKIAIRANKRENIFKLDNLYSELMNISFKIISIEYY
jgi:hypothetical protein